MDQILSLCKDVAQFLFSTLHLLLTRVLPLIAMIVGSLLLHVFRFIISAFLFPWPAVLISTKALFFKKRRAQLQGRAVAAYGSLAFYYREAGGGGSGSGASAALQAECSDDCLDADEHFIEEQRLLLSEYEEEAIHGEGGDHSVNHLGDFEKEGIGRFQKNEGDLIYAEVGNIAEKDQKGDNPQNTIGAGLVSQASLFPSDLPPSLDEIVNAAAAAKHNAVTSRRTLPPTLSDIQKVLQDIHSASLMKQSPPRNVNLHVAPARQSRN